MMMHDDKESHTAPQLESSEVCHVLRHVQRCGHDGTAADFFDRTTRPSPFILLRILTNKKNGFQLAGHAIDSSETITAFPWFSLPFTG